jgi:hypothetical protein
MNKTEREALRKKGIMILREQFVPAKYKWIISFLTVKGGWSRWNSEWFQMKETAEQRINELIEKYPNSFAKD